MKTKEEVIKESYGEYWEQLSISAKSSAINNNGWIHYNFTVNEKVTLIDCIEMDVLKKIYFYRPKSLQGIEDFYSFIDIEGFSNYMVNKQGIVISKSRTFIRKNGRKCSVKFRIMKPQLDKTGYITFRLSREGGATKQYLHRILAMAFIPNPENKLCINHKDGVKDNNNLCNLEWCTYKENNNHAFNLGLNSTIGSRIKGKKGVDCHNYNKRNKMVYSEGFEYASVREASEQLGITEGYIYQCLNGSANNVHGLSYQPIIKPKPPLY